MLDCDFSIAYLRFWEAIIKTSKIHNVNLGTYLYKIQIIHILVHWNPLENEDKAHNFFCHFINSIIN
jgi:hypothetical protein